MAARNVHNRVGKIKSSSVYASFKVISYIKPAFSKNLIPWSTDLASLFGWLHDTQKYRRSLFQVAKNNVIKLNFQGKQTNFPPYRRRRQKRKSSVEKKKQFLKHFPGWNFYCNHQLMLKKLVFLFSIGRVRHGRCYFATLTIELSCVLPNVQMQTWWVRGGTDPWKCKRMVSRWACRGSPLGQWPQGGICQAGALPTAPWREWQSLPQSVLSVSTNGSGKVGAGPWDLKERSLEPLCPPAPVAHGFPSPLLATSTPDPDPAACSHQRFAEAPFVTATARSFFSERVCPHNMPDAGLRFNPGNCSLGTLVGK